MYVLWQGTRHGVVGEAEEHLQHGARVGVGPQHAEDELELRGDGALEVVVLRGNGLVLSAPQNNVAGSAGVCKLTASCSIIGAVCCLLSE